MNTNTDSSEISRLIEVIENLNARISALEASAPYQRTEPASGTKLQLNKESSEDLEFRIGEQWFGKIGVVAFF
jgi:hypothetical protein